MSKQTELAQVADTITVDSGNVGIGTSSPNVQLKLEHANSPSVALKDLSTNDELYITVENDIAEFNAYTAGTGARVPIVFTQYTDERMRLDASGNLLVGTTDNLPVANNDASGIALRSDGNAQFSRSNAATARFNRGTSDGEIVSFSKNSSTAGSIGVNGVVFYWKNHQASSDTGVGIAGGGQFIAVSSTGNGLDNSRDLGASTIRWDDVYATNSNINTSDRNEKQDIEVLSDAETRVAQACKGLLRKFRWRDAVAKKGDDARIHCGIIAQDLQAAFAAEGLDAGDYAMFISSTWWETQTEVPAVEAVAEVLDEEGNVVTEAVEAKDAYTRTDIYETQEEAPEGATERTRLGVRYSELLAFIIGAL